MPLGQRLHALQELEHDTAKHLKKANGGIPNDATFGNASGAAQENGWTPASGMNSPFRRLITTSRRRVACQVSVDFAESVEEAEATMLLAKRVLVTSMPDFRPIFFPMKGGRSFDVFRFERDYERVLERVRANWEPAIKKYKQDRAPRRARAAC